MRGEKLHTVSTNNGYELTLPGSRMGREEELKRLGESLHVAIEEILHTKGRLEKDF